MKIYTEPGKGQAQFSDSLSYGEGSEYDYKPQEIYRQKGRGQAQFIKTLSDSWAEGDLDYDYKQQEIDPYCQAYGKAVEDPVFLQIYNRKPSSKDKVKYCVERAHKSLQGVGHTPQVHQKSRFKRSLDRLKKKTQPLSKGLEGVTYSKARNIKQLSDKFYKTSPGPQKEKLRLQIQSHCDEYVPSYMPEYKDDYRSMILDDNEGRVNTCIGLVSQTLKQSPVGRSKEYLKQYENPFSSLKSKNVGPQIKERIGKLKQSMSPDRVRSPGFKMPSMKSPGFKMPSMKSPGFKMKHKSPVEYFRRRSSPSPYQFV